MKVPVPLPGWTIHSTSRSDERTELDASYDQETLRCPRCGKDGMTVRRGTKPGTFLDAPAGGSPLSIRVRRIRYSCRACHANFMQDIPDLDDGRRMTARCREFIEQQGRLMTNVAVASLLGVVEKTVRDVLDQADGAPKRPGRPGRAALESRQRLIEMMEECSSCRGLFDRSALETIRVSADATDTVSMCRRCHALHDSGVLG